jgi:hypothetical protein
VSNDGYLNTSHLRSNHMNFYLLAVLLISVSLPSHGADFPLYAFDQARVIEEEQRQVSSYRLALGLYVKRQNRWQPEVEKRLRGYLQRQTHEFSAGFDELEIFQFYRDQLPEAVKILFECERRDCGESNNWANDHFRIKQLYGLNQHQFYGVYQIDAQKYLSLYTVRRGNRRIYTQIDFLVASP